MNRIKDKKRVVDERLNDSLFESIFIENMLTQDLFKIFE